MIKDASPVLCFPTGCHNSEIQPIGLAFCEDQRIDKIWASTSLTRSSTPAVVYRSYLAAVWEELWAFDKDRHMMQDVEDLADVVDIVRKNFTSSRADLIQKITAYAVGRRRAVQGEKVSNTQLPDHLIQSVELVLHSTPDQCRTSTDKAEGSCFT